MDYFYIDYDDKKGEIRLTKAVNLSPFLTKVKKERSLIGKGFSKKKTIRKIGSIPIDVLLKYNIDINDDKAIRKFLREHPEYRTSEGEI